MVRLEFSWSRVLSESSLLFLRGFWVSDFSVLWALKACLAYVCLLHPAFGSYKMNLPSTQQNLTQPWQMHLWISWFRLPATSTISPGTMSRALTLWTLFLSCRYTLPISGSYSFRASMAFSALRSCRTQWHVSFQHSSCMLVCGHQTWQEITHTHTQA